MADQPNLNELHALIDTLLREQRPDRYTVGDDWILGVVDAIPAHLVPAEDARRIAISQEVKRREGQATRKANKLLREIGRTGQLTLCWAEQADDPISIITTHVDDDGNVRRIEERVALRAATADDFRAWSRVERERSEDDYKSRLIACDGADFIADGMDGAGLRSFKQWAESIAPTAS